MSTTAKTISLLFAVLALAAGLLLLAPGGAPAAPSPSVCSDGLDNDADGRADFPADTGCGSENSDSEADEVEAGEVRRACSDGLDNDADGRVDFPADPGCGSPNSGEETDEADEISACSDGLDNDGDGRVDHPADPDCGSPNSDSESDEPGDDRRRRGALDARGRPTIKISGDRCDGGDVVATVRGRRMSRVALSVDGERVATRNSKRGRSIVRVTLDDLDSGAHRLVARVQQRGARGTRTLRVRFGTCDA
jgi:hypothetical protein